MSDTYNPVVRPEKLPLEHFEHGENYVSADAGVADALGLTQIGCAYTVVPPGKSACPFHVHHGEDEMFVVLEGTGEYRFGDKRHPISAGDILGAPAGGRDYAHQIWNTGSVDLKYLGISNKLPLEVVEYPDSGKVLALSHRDGPGKFGFRHMTKHGDNVDYFEGDPYA